MTQQATKVSPPGQERPYPEPTLSGRIPFTYPKTGLKGETAYWIWGDLATTAKTPLICLHGGPGMPHTYILPVSLIYADHGIPVLMYDQVGCGESTHFVDKKGDADFWTPELFMAELDNVIAHFKIQTYDLFGQSWGGMLAGQYAISQPRGLRKLIIEGGPATMKTYSSITARLVAQLPESMQKIFAEDKREREEYKHAELYYYSLYCCRVSPWPKELVQAFEQVEMDNTVYSTMMGPSELLCEGTLRKWSIEEELHKITKKTVPGGMLVMNGAYDSIQDEIMEAFLWRPSCRVKWIRYGLSSHVPFLEETERFIKDLGTFLTQE